MIPPLDLLGYTASIASGGTSLPQAIKALRTRRTRDLSLPAAALEAAESIHVLETDP